jgi:hypothetical protein
MRYFRIVICFLISLIAIKSFGQNTSKLTLLDKKNSIIFSPFDLLNPINPSLKFGYQRLFKNKYELQIEYGYIINKALFHYLIHPNEDKDDYSNKGNKLGIELKRYINGNDFYRYYFSSEFYYLENISKVQNQFIVSDPNYDYSFDLPDYGKDYYYTDYFTTSKTKYGLNAKIGIKLITDPIFFEASAGIGIAYRNNIHTDRENINDKPYDSSYLNDNIPKEMLMLSLPIHFKIGFMF